MGHVEKPRLAVEGHVIPAALPAEHVLLEQMVAGRRGETPETTRTQRTKTAIFRCFMRTSLSKDQDITSRRGAPRALRAKAPAYAPKKATASARSDPTF